MMKEIKLLLGNTFKVTSEPSGAKVTYIVDPYDRNKDITAITPCALTIPWEPQRALHNKDKLLIEKKEFRPKVVRFKYGIKTILKFLMFAFILLGIYFFSGDYQNHCIWSYIIILMMYSIGSDDLHIVLEKE